MLVTLAYFCVGIVVGAIGHEKIQPVYEKVLHIGHTQYKDKVLVHKVQE